MDDAIIQGVDGLQRLLVYDRSLQPAGRQPEFSFFYEWLLMRLMAVDLCHKCTKHQFIHLLTATYND